MIINVTQGDNCCVIPYSTFSRPFPFSPEHLKSWLSILVSHLIVYKLIRAPIAKGDRIFIIPGNRSEHNCHPLISSYHFSWQFSIRSVCVTFRRSQAKLRHYGELRHYSHLLIASIFGQKILSLTECPCTKHQKILNEYTQEFHPHNQKLEPPCTVY